MINNSSNRSTYRSRTQLSNENKLLFDAGSADDKKTNSLQGSRSRLVAYLNAALGRFNQPHCRSLGDVEVPTSSKAPRLDYVFLSHPHEDHLSQFLPVLQCFAVKSLWEPGITHKTAGYQQFRQFMQDDKSISCHTAVKQPCPRGLRASSRCSRQFQIGDDLQLGHQANAKVLPVGTKPSHHPNLYSVVLPDQAVVDALSKQGLQIYRTDRHNQKGCPVADKIGANNAGNPGGCDNFIIRMNTTTP